MARITWIRLPADFLSPRRMCETPRHKGHDIEASYLLGVTGQNDMDDYAIRICRDCVAMIATDLGTTPEAGAVEP